MSDKPSFLRRFIKDRNRNAILICVVIAVSFWLTDALSHAYTHDYIFTLEYKLQDNVSFASAPRDQIEARLSGKGWELLKASIKRKFRHVPVSVVRAEITRSDLIAAVYQHLSDYEIVVREVDVDVMTLDINMVIARTMPVPLNITAVCADGFVFKDSLHLSPARVSVVGPTSLVERIGTIRIEPVELSPLNANLNQIVNIIPPESPYITIEPKQIHLIADVEKLIQITTVLSLQIDGDTTGFVCTPESISVSYSIGESLTNSPELDSITVIALILHEDLLAGRAPITVHDVPAYVQDLQFRPEYVMLDSIPEYTAVDSVREDSL